MRLLRTLCSTLTLTLTLGAYAFRVDVSDVDDSRQVRSSEVSLFLFLLPQRMTRSRLINPSQSLYRSVAECGRGGGEVGVSEPV
jgi:hypothetical protein